MAASEGRVVIVQGRIVWASGDLFKGKQQTQFGTSIPKINPKTGEQDVQFGFGLSIPTAELSDPTRAGVLWVAMHEEAYIMFPSRQIPPSFAMKFKDGVTGIDENGKPYALREGYKDCYVFAMTTNLPIRFFKWEGGQNIQVADGIKCGDYVNVQVTVKAHAAVGQGKAGLYLNPNCVQLVAPGKEIVNAPTGDMVFGMSAPPTPSNYVLPEQPVMPAMAQPGPAMPIMPPTAAAPPQPHYAVIPPSHQPPPGGMPMPGAAQGWAPPPTGQYPAQPVMPAPGPGGYPMPGR